MANLDKIMEQLGELSVLEAAELVKKLEESWVYLQLLRLPQLRQCPLLQLRKQRKKRANLT